MRVWQAKHEKDLPKLLLLKQEKGIAIPILDNAPKLTNGLQFYLEAFRSLRSDRQIGMGIGPIPWSAIERYATRHNLDNDELETFERHMRAMENALFEQETNANSGEKGK